MDQISEAYKFVSLEEFRRYWREDGGAALDNAYSMARAITFNAFFTPKLCPERKPLVHFRIAGAWQPHPEPGSIYYDEFTEYIAWIIRKLLAAALAPHGGCSGGTGSGSL